MAIPTTTIRGGFLAILATTMLAGCGAGPTATPTEDASASPSASPTPSSTVVAYADGVAPGEITVDPALPDALPLPDGIWEETGPGWVLATYSPRVVWWNNDTASLDIEVTTHVVYLVSPKGQRYQVLELDPYRSISIESWMAGETEAIVVETPLTTPTAAPKIEVLDLTTGEVSPYPTPFASGTVLFNLPGGVRVWDSFESGSFVDRGGEFVPLKAGWYPALFWPDAPSPDSAWIAVTRGWPGGTDGYSTGVLSVATGEVTAFPALDEVGSCYPTGWADVARLTVACMDDVEGPHQWFDVDASTGAVAESAFVEPPHEAIRVDHTLWISPGVWAGKYGVWEPEAEMSNDVGIDDHGAVREIVVLDALGRPFQRTLLFGLVDGVLYFDGTAAPGESFAAETVVAYDLATDQQVVLLPVPPAGPASGLREGSAGVTSWVIAP